MAWMLVLENKLEMIYFISKVLRGGGLDIEETENEVEVLWRFGVAG